MYKMHHAPHDAEYKLLIKKYKNYVQYLKKSDLGGNGPCLIWCGFTEALALGHGEWRSYGEYGIMNDELDSDPDFIKL